MRRLRVVCCGPPVALHAALVLCGKSRQDVSNFVTSAAFLFGRSGQLDPAFSSCVRCLVVGFMAADAVRQLLPGLTRKTAMRAFVDLLQDIKVAVFTPLDTEEILEALVDVPGIRMKLLLGNVPMAFQAGGLAMGRNMESFRVNQPLGPGTLSPA